MRIDSGTKKLMIGHIKEHTGYPATRTDLIKACSNLSDFTKEQKRWFERTLPSGTYRTPSEVIKAIGF